MKIQFIKDTSKAIIPEHLDSDDTIVVYRDGYKLPELKNAVYVDFEKYKSTYLNFKQSNLIMVGTNRIFIPQNRCDMVYEYLQTMSNHINKYSIDTLPFVGEPWRMWFNFSLVYGRWLDFNYSYVVETDWQHWFYRDQEDSVISANSINGKLDDVYSDLDEIQFDVEYYDPDLFLLDVYNKVKEFAFGKYSTPKQIVSTMLKELNKHLDIKFSYESFLTERKVKLPNLGVYRFVAEENKRRVDIYNTIAKL
ncbi:MAG: hypothetical protein ACRCZY_05890 [Phocaeicola sp.]